MLGGMSVRRSMADPCAIQRGKTFGPAHGVSTPCAKHLQDLSRRLREEQDAEFNSSLEADRWA